MERVMIPKEVFEKELGDMVQQLDAFVYECHEMFQDTENDAWSIRFTSQAKTNELLERWQILETEDSCIQTERDNQQKEQVEFEDRIKQAQSNIEDLHERTAHLLQIKEKREQLVTKAMSEIAGKLSRRKQKVEALREATAWYKRLLSMRCEYSDGSVINSASNMENDSSTNAFMDDFLLVSCAPK